MNTIFTRLSIVALILGAALTGKSQILFSETFNSNLGLTTAANGVSGNWIWSNSCASSSSGGHSAPGHAIFSGSGCQFGNSSNQVIGTLTTPQIAIGPSGAVLTFNYLANGECGALSTCNYDRLIFQISNNGGSTFTDIMSTTGSPAGLTHTSGWTPVTFNLNSYANQNIMIRFRFDSWDGAINAYDGIYIDDIIVTGNCALNGFATNGTNSIVPIVCSGNSITLGTNGISNYNWSTGATTPTISVAPTTNTSYTITAMSPQNCITYAVINVTVNNGFPVISIVNSTSSNSLGVCPTKTVTLTASGANTYTWAGGTAVTNGVPFSPGSSSGYTVSGQNACGITTGVTSVSIHPTPNISASTSQPTLCSGQSITLTATGNGTSYSWSGGATNGASFMPTLSGNYVATVFSSHGCTNTAVVALTVVTTPILAPVLSSSLICNGQTATITASGATNYSWMPMNLSTSAITVAPSSNAFYTLTKWNANCYDTKTFTLYVNQPPTVNILISSPTVCANNPITLTTGGATNYTWYPSGGTQYTAVVSPAATTIYTVAAHDGTCINTGTILAYVNPNPVLSITGTSTLCAGQVGNISVSGALTYTWAQTFLSGNSVTVSPATTTVYAVSGTNQYSCTTGNSHLIIVSPLPTLNVAMSKTLICSGAPATLTASGQSSSYVWAHGPTTATSVVTPTSTTVYTVTGTNFQCSNTKTVEVKIFTPTFEVTPDTAICIGGAVILTATGANSYTWHAEAPGQSIQVSPAATSIYTVTALGSSQNNYANCTATKTVMVSIYNNPTITATSSRAQICRNEKVTLTATGGTSYDWSNTMTGGTITVSPLNEIKYTVEGTDAFGCKGTGTVTVRVSACPGIFENGSELGGISVYPNPNNGAFVVKSEIELTLQLINELGQVVQFIELDGKNAYSVNVNQLANGIYFLTGRSGDASVSHKIVVNK